jgi:integrase/recombinase XerC
MILTAETTLSAATERWIKLRVSTNKLKPRSVRIYRQHYAHAIAFLGDPAVGSITFDDAENWHISLGYLGGSTHYSRLSAMVVFFDYLVDREVVPSNPFRRLERPARKGPNPKPAADEATTTILSRATRQQRLMILLAWHLALRRFEIAKLRRSDFDLSSLILEVEGKGEKSARLPVTVEVAREVVEWCESNDIGPTGYLFKGRTPGEPMSAGQVGRIMTEASHRIGAHITPHQYRHKAATDMTRRHGIKAAQVLLRHSSSATTDIYAKFDVEELRPLQADMHPDAA